MKQFLSWSLKFVPRSTANLPWIDMIRTGEVTSIHGPVVPINLRCVASVPRHPKQEVNATQMQVYKHNDSGQLEGSNTKVSTWLRANMDQSAEGLRLRGTKTRNSLGGSDLPGANIEGKQQCLVDHTDHVVTYKHLQSFVSPRLGVVSQ